MPASKSRLPSLEDLKNFDPKRFAIDHGEKVVLAVCVLLAAVGLVTLVGGVAGGGRQWGDVSRGADTLDKRFNDPADALDTAPFGKELEIWNQPLPRSDAWDTWVARMVEARIALGADRRIEKEPSLFADRPPDVPGTVHLRDLSVDHGYGWVLTGARANPKHVALWEQGLLAPNAIQVIDESADMQWAVVYAWFDLRALVDDTNQLLKALDEVIRLEEEALKRAQAGGGRAPERRVRPEREKLALWMPEFAGFEVLREDLSRPGVWERVEVPPPVLPDVRWGVLPRPRDLPADQPWPPKPMDPWEDGPAGINTVVRCDPYPVLPGRIKTTQPPALFLTERSRLPGGIYLHSDPSVLAEIIGRLMTEYVDASQRLKEAPNVAGVPERAGDQRDVAIWNRTVQREHGMGVRFVDTTVQPGHRYRYRLRLLLENPCKDLPEKYASPEARKDEILKSDFSPPSPVIDVPHNVEFYLQIAGPARPGARAEKAVVEMHALYRGVWRVVTPTVWVGQRIAWTGPLEVVKMVEAVNPALPAAPPRGPAPGWEPGARPGWEPGARPGWEGPGEFRPGLVGRAGERGEREGPQAVQPGGWKVVKETVTLDSGAVLVDLVPVQVLQPIFSLQEVVDTTTVPPKRTSVRNFLAPTKFIRRDNLHRMVFLDAAGVVGAVLQGDMPERARIRAANYRRWLESGLKDLQPERERRPGRRPERERPPGEEDRWREERWPPEETGEWRPERRED